MLSIRAFHSLSFASRAMSHLASAPTFKPFNLALIQLGGVGSDKSANLKHAREMILKAAAGKESKRPDVIVLPVCRVSMFVNLVLPLLS